LRNVIRTVGNMVGRVITGGKMPPFVDATVIAITAADDIYSGVSGRPDVVRGLNELLATDDIEEIPGRAGGDRPWDRKPSTVIPSQTTVPNIPQTSPQSGGPSSECASAETGN